MRGLVFHLLLVCSLAQVAYGADDEIFAAEISQGTLIMVLPDMARKMIIGANAQVIAPGGLGGNARRGVRGQVFVYNARSAAISLEGMAQGYSVGSESIFDMAHSFGGGVRLHLPLVSDGRNDALMVSPGVDVLYVLGKEVTAGFRLGRWPYTDVVLIGTSIDVSWLHMFAAHFGIEVGVSAHLDIAVHGRDNTNEKTEGRLYPSASLFGGVRF